MPSSNSTLFSFFRDFFSHCGLRDVRHVHNMASIQKLTMLGKAIEVPFIIVIALLHQSDAVLPRYIPVLQQSCVECDDLIERYFQHGNNGVDRPARLSRACFSLSQSFALMSISFKEHPFLYEMSGFPL